MINEAKLILNRFTHSYMYIVKSKRLSQVSVARKKKARLRSNYKWT